MKGYLSIRETSYKWNVSERRVNQYVTEGRIPGVERFGKSWAIPEDAKKPTDPRKEKDIGRFKGEPTMKHKVRLTVIDKKLYPKLQAQYCINPNSGACPCYNVGDVFDFYRDGDRDDFWHCGLNTLVHTDANPNSVAGGPKMPHCSELWDAISRYIYTGLQGGSIMKGWMAKENEMIACCSDGTRPVIVKIERIDYEE